MLACMSSTMRMLSSTKPIGSKQLASNHTYHWTYINIDQINLSDDMWHKVDKMHQEANSIIMEGRELKYLQEILENQQHLNALMCIRDSVGYTLIQTAILLNREEIVKYLISKGADLNAPICGRPLHLSMSLGRANLVPVLLELGADPQLKSNVCYPGDHFYSRATFNTNIKHWTVVCAGDYMQSDSAVKLGKCPLYFAISSDNLKTLLVFLNKVPRAIHRKSDEWILRTSCHVGALKCMKHFIELVPSSVLTETDNEYGTSLIQDAVMWGKPYVECLMKAGIDITETLPYSQTLMQYVISNFHYFTEGALLLPQWKVVDHSLSYRIKFLLDFGLSMTINRRDYYGFTALLHVFYYHLLVLEMLELDNNQSSKTTSISESKCSSQEIVLKIHDDILCCIEMLVNAGANVNIQCRDGTSCLHILGQVSVVITQKFKLYSPEEICSTEDLHKVLVDVLEVLLKAGCHTNATDYIGASVAHVFIRASRMGLYSNAPKSLADLGKENHLSISPKMIELLQNAGCNFFGYATKHHHYACGFYAVLNNLEHQLYEMVSWNLFGVIPRTKSMLEDLVLRYYPLLAQILHGHKRHDECPCKSNHFYMICQILQPYVRHITFKTFRQFLHTSLVAGSAPSDRAEVEELASSLHIFTAGATPYSFEEKVELIFLIANGVGQKHSRLILKHFVEHNSGLSNARPSQAVQLSTVTYLLTNTHSLRHLAAWAAYEGLNRKLSHASKLPLPSILQQYLQSMAY